jgi:hypothetical protein
MPLNLQKKEGTVFPSFYLSLKSTGLKDLSLSGGK